VRDEKGRLLKGYNSRSIKNLKGAKDNVSNVVKNNVFRDNEVKEKSFEERVEGFIDSFFDEGIDLVRRLDFKDFKSKLLFSSSYRNELEDWLREELNKFRV